MGNTNQTAVFLGEWVTTNKLAQTHRIDHKEYTVEGTVLVFSCGNKTMHDAYKAPWYPRCGVCATFAQSKDKEPITWAG